MDTASMEPDPACWRRHAEFLDEQISLGERLIERIQQIVDYLDWFNEDFLPIA